MRTVIVVLCMTIFLGGFSFYEKSQTNGFCKETKKLAVKLENLVLNSKERTNEIDKIKNIWDTKKKTLYMFANHNSFKDLETTIFNVDFYHKNKDENKELYYVRKLLNIIDELKDISRFDLSNIL